MSIKKGDNVKVEYTGTFNDGTVFDSSEKQGKPLEFEVGSGQLIKGFDNAVIGMKKGDEREIKVEPADAYGDHNPQLIQKIPRAQLAEGEPKPGTMLLVTAPDGHQFPAQITEVTEEEITVDLNHPLAGKTLNFKIKIVDGS